MLIWLSCCLFYLYHLLLLVGYPNDLSLKSFTFEVINIQLACIEYILCRKLDRGTRVQCVHCFITIMLYPLLDLLVDDGGPVSFLKVGFHGFPKVGFVVCMVGSYWYWEPMSRVLSILDIIVWGQAMILSMGIDAVASRHILGTYLGVYLVHFQWYLSLNNVDLVRFI